MFIMVNLFKAGPESFQMGPCTSGQKIVAMDHQPNIWLLREKDIGAGPTPDIPKTFQELCVSVFPIRCDVSSAAHRIFELPADLGISASRVFKWKSHKFTLLARRIKMLSFMFNNNMHVGSKLSSQLAARAVKIRSASSGRCLNANRILPLSPICLRT